MYGAAGCSCFRLQSAEWQEEGAEHYWHSGIHTLTAAHRLSVKHTPSYDFLRARDSTVRAENTDVIHELFQTNVEKTHDFFLVFFPDVRVVFLVFLKKGLFPVGNFKDLMYFRVVDIYVDLTAGFYLSDTLIKC